jgi:proteasome lid subunit RPN8/RPN11
MPRDEPDSRCLRFAPLAWLKWQFLCHAGPTEVAVFGRSDPDDLLCVEDVLVVRQRATAVTVAMDDEAVAELFDELVDLGHSPREFARVWLHTHPGASVVPSRTDEATFARDFGGCDWAVMAILGRTGRASARLQFTAGPGGSVELAVAVDWSCWPAQAAGPGPMLDELVAGWQAEYESLVEPMEPARPPAGRSSRPDEGQHFGARQDLLDDPFESGGRHVFE